MKKIEVKFPEIEGMRVSSATLDFENGCSVVEYVDDVFKKGDIVYHNTGVNKWVFIYTNTRNGDYNGLSCVHPITGEYYPIYNNEVGVYSRLATDSEKQLLFDALEKEGKYWDAEALEVKEFDRVPENIHIYRGKNDPSDKLWIGFGDDQLLGEYSGKYTVMGRHDRYSRVNCYLKPITIDEICVGDTIVTYDCNILNNYTKVCNNLIVYISSDSDVFTMDEFDDNIELFKLIPIR